MKPNENKYNTQAEMTDLIAEAVVNAAARRNLAIDSEETLLELFDEQAKTVMGGQTFPKLSPSIVGKVIKLPPTTVGIIEQPFPNL